MTPEELNTIEQRANAANPGPWHVIIDSEGDDDHVRYILCSIIDRDSEPVIEDTLFAGNYLGFPNAEFIAHARSDIPTLIQEIKRLQASLIDERERIAILIENLSGRGFTERDARTCKMLANLIRKDIL